MPSLLKRYADVLHYAAGYHPALFYPLARRRRARTAGNLVTPDCDIVIEGYPRCGNTFALNAFLFAQPGPVKTADHVHVPAQVMRAVRLGLPTLVVIREPEAAVRSLVVKHGFVRPKDALRGYWLFYRSILGARRGYVAADFAEVTTDFGGVCRRLNARFQTGFAEFRHNEETEAAVFARIEARNRALGQGETEIARPSAAKQAPKQAVDLTGCTAWLQRCRNLYARFGRLTGATPAPPLV